MMEKFPNFFIVGAPKAGTTSLYEYLKTQPEVFMSPIKEPNFFSYDETVKQNLYHKEKGVGTLKEYRQLFEGANGHHKLIGEASVSYLFYPSVPGKIKEMSPQARILMSLRNPVDRAFSHYFMEYKLGYVTVPFQDIVFKRTKNKKAHLWYQQYVELGMYYEQVKRYLDAFPKDHVRIYIYDDIQANLDGCMEDLFDFLELDKALLPKLKGKYNTYSTPRNKVVHWLYSQKRLRTLARKVVPAGGVERAKNIFLTRNKGNEKNAEVTAELARIYKPDIQKLEKLLDKNLSAWYE